MSIWTISWSHQVSSIDFETTADIEADSATNAVKKFIQLLGNTYFVNWNKHIFKAEKNYTFFLFTIENNVLRRV